MRSITRLARWLRSLFTRLIGFLLLKPENLYHLTIVVATIVAGYWTYYIFIAERNPNAHLFMDAKMTVATNTPSLGDRKLIFLDVFLNNTGKRKIVAIKVPASQMAYSDPSETIHYPCGVQIRKILTPLIQANKWLDWFNDTNLLQCPEGIPTEIDLLEECELPDGTPDFWIEPSDQCHLGSALILSRGDYLVKLHFIGSDTNEDFWSRIIYVQIN